MRRGVAAIRQIKVRLPWLGASFADGKRSKTAAKGRRISCAQRRETADSAAVRFNSHVLSPAKRLKSLR